MIKTKTNKQTNKHEIVVFLLSYSDIGTRLPRPKVAMYASSDGTPSNRSSLGAMEKLGVPQSIRARMRCLSPYTSPTESS
jgi:hypothetical protein